MRIDLTKGNIYKKLIILAIPIMGTSLIQAAYSMTDMIWVGRLGSRAVTAVGAAGFFTWFAFAFITIPQIGAAVGVSQSVGRKDIKETKSYKRDQKLYKAFSANEYSFCYFVWGYIDNI
ncbi:MATE family efflux transporter [Clostridium tagluense]|uniref:Probable multidrug resistance protein NorM n=1 Tax=Clostridium tagluense TaxID=360422 RepID=A0A401UST3_9CLOT|nr:hypothetical protein Ctaglu_41890 [Clostridium tagluense]